MTTNLSSHESVSTPPLELLTEVHPQAAQQYKPHLSNFGPWCPWFSMAVCHWGPGHGHWFSARNGLYPGPHPLNNATDACGSACPRHHGTCTKCWRMDMWSDCLSKSKLLSRHDYHKDTKQWSWFTWIDCNFGKWRWPSGAHSTAQDTAATNKVFEEDNHDAIPGRSTWPKILNRA